jgi:hypothetical protein
VRPRAAAVVASVLALGPFASCSDAHVGAPAGRSAALDALIALAAPGEWRAGGVDRIEVWVCRVPAGSTSAVYGGLPLRLPLTPAHVAQVVEARVASYFRSISHGLYMPEFVAGGEVAMGVHDEPQSCVDSAIAGAGPAARAVLAVADAEHAEGRSGGFGTGGDACPGHGPCSVHESRRAAYIGASDFSPDWGEQPPMDLVEHEIGHTLGWVHSGYDENRTQPYLSGLDLMSDSAAPREALASRRDGPDTLAVDRLIAGWLPPSGVTVAPAAGATLTLAPSTGGAGARLLVLPVDSATFLSVELLTARGFDAHLPSAGLAVHRVHLSAGGVDPLQPLVGTPPYTSLLQPGGALVVDGWRVTAGSGGGVTALPAAPAG